MYITWYSSVQLTGLVDWPYDAIVCFVIRFVGSKLTELITWLAVDEIQADLAERDERERELPEKIR